MLNNFSGSKFYYKASIIYNLLLKLPVWKRKNTELFYINSSSLKMLLIFLILTLYLILTGII